MSQTPDRVEILVNEDCCNGDYNHGKGKRQPSFRRYESHGIKQGKAIFI